MEHTFAIGNVGQIFLISLLFIFVLLDFLSLNELIFPIENLYWPILYC